mgnify:CR=1 FL=1
MTKIFVLYSNIHDLPRLDYCGIAVLIIGSVVPLLYYQFYCEFGTKVAYLSLIGLLVAACIVISLWDRFATSDYRVYRVCKMIFVCLFVFFYNLSSIRFSIIYYIWSFRIYSNLSLYFSIWS